MQTNKNFEEKKKLYNQNFSLGYIGKDFSERVALISLTSYLLQKLRVKKSNLTFLDLLKFLAKDIQIDENLLQSLAIVGDDLSYGTTEFPTFGLKDKEIPEKIKELISNWLPF